MGILHAGAWGGLLAQAPAGAPPGVRFSCCPCSPHRRFRSRAEEAGLSAGPASLALPNTLCAQHAAICAKPHFLPRSSVWGRGARPHFLSAVFFVPSQPGLPFSGETLPWVGLSPPAPGRCSWGARLQAPGHRPGLRARVALPPLWPSLSTHGSGRCDAVTQGWAW